MTDDAPPTTPRPAPPATGPAPGAPPATSSVRGGSVGAVVAWATLLALLALWTVTAFGRVWRAPPAVFVAVVTFLPYLYAALAAWAFGVWSALPDRRVPPVILAGLGLSAAALWGPSLRAAANPFVGTPIRAATWNVRRLWGPEGALGRPDERREAVRCVVDGVETIAPDVVALLEVSATDIADLSARLDLSCVHGDYLGVEGDDLGGLALCVRGGSWTITRGGAHPYIDPDPWTYVSAELGHGDGTHVNAFAVHLQPYAFGTTRIRKRIQEHGAEDLIALSHHGEAVSRAQSDQTAALLDRMQRLKDPTMVLGDFNSTRDTALHTSLRDSLVDTWEAGGRGFGPTVRFLDLVPLRVDYVYATPSLGVVGASVPSYDCSDHRPVVSDLRLTSGAK